MERALVVFDADEDGRRLLREAGELAAGTDAHLTVLSLMTADEFTEKREALEAAGRGENTTYDESAVLDSLRQSAEEVVESELGETDVDWDAVAGRIGDGDSAADRILAAADANDVDHVFVSGRKRSPTGKAVFGDRAQAVILNFDGPVTTLLN